MTRNHLLASIVVAILMPVAAPASEPAPRSFVTHHTVTLKGEKLRYTAAVEEFLLTNETGAPALSLFATSYIRDGVKEASRRPVVFLFNGGPSAAATGVHMQFGPIHESSPAASAKADEPTHFSDNPDSILDLADLVAFDPAETGFSRVLPAGARADYYSAEGDAESFTQLVGKWLKAHGREHSPLYVLGESYGSIRAVLASKMLRQAGTHLDGLIIFGDSLFLQETSRRTHNIVSTAVSLPLLAMTAAYHGKADKRGKSDAAFLDEVYLYATTDYLMALSKGYDIGSAEKKSVANRLASYTGIPAEYYLSHNLTVAKQDFNRMLVPGKVLNALDTRIAMDAQPPSQNKSRSQPSPAELARGSGPRRNVYQDYMTTLLHVELQPLEYREIAPDSFDTWNWGNGCNEYLQSSGLCNPKNPLPSVFEDYDWPEVLKDDFTDTKFRTMIVASYYDGLSSIGTHRYLETQLGYPKDRFSIHEFAAGHATAGDPAVRPSVMRDVRAFLAN